MIPLSDAQSGQVPGVRKSRGAWEQLQLHKDRSCHKPAGGEDLGLAAGNGDGNVFKLTVYFTSK